MQNLRRGLSLVEMLVVLAIIGISAGLILPAIFVARGSSRQAECQNNLKNIVLGVLSHEFKQQQLPSLYNGTFLPQPRSAIDEFHFHSWRIAVLPYIDESNLYNSLNMSLPATTPENQTSLNVSIRVFLCPSSENSNAKLPKVMAWNDGSIPKQSVGTAARCDFEVIGGVQVSRQIKTSADLSNCRFGAWGEPTYDVNTGASIRYRQARLADISDGTSFTFLIGERAGRPDLYQRGQRPDPFPYRDPAKATDSQQAAWGVSTHFRWTIFSNTQRVNDTNSTGIYSFHPGVAHVSMADGSLRSLKESTNKAVLQALATRAGGEILSNW